MTGTTFKTGVSTRKKYSGKSQDDAANSYHVSASTKPIRRTAVIHCIGSEADNSERTTDFTFPDSAIVHDVYLYVHTADDSETVDVGTEGTSNDPNGFLAAISLANTGVVYPVLTTGSETLGALLTNESEAGTTDATVKMPYAGAGGDPVSFTCSAGTDTAVFDIIIEYDEIEVDPN